MIADARADPSMRPKVLILYPQRRMPRSVSLLSLAFARLGASAIARSFEEVSCGSISKYDIVVLRGLPYHYDAVRLSALISCLYGAKFVVNDPWAMIKSRDKYTSILELRKKGIPTPKTYLARTRAELVERIQELGEVVLKPLSGSLGFGIMRVEEETIFYKLSSLPFNFEIVVQEYLEKVRDVRVLVLGEKALGAMYRVSPTNFVSNFAQGAEVDPAPKELYEELAVKASKALGLEYSGVDLVETPRGPVVLEVNPAPLWFGLSEALGRDLTVDIARFILKAYEDKTGAER